VQVKKKVKEKKGRSERPRIDKGREAIPSGVNFVVDGVDHIKPSVQIGAVSVGQIGVLGGGVAGEGVDEVHERENETFFGAVNFFFRFFSDFFSECGTFRASWNIFVEHFFLRGTFFFLDTRLARGRAWPGILAWCTWRIKNLPSREILGFSPGLARIYIALYKPLYIIYETSAQLLYGPSV